LQVKEKVSKDQISKQKEEIPFLPSQVSQTHSNYQLANNMLLALKEERDHMITVKKKLI
jgi:hypothetical protein